MKLHHVLTALFVFLLLRDLPAGQTECPEFEVRVVADPVSQKMGATGTEPEAGTKAVPIESQRLEEIRQLPGITIRNGDELLVLVGDGDITNEDASGWAPETDHKGRPAILVFFDGQGGDKLEAFTEANMGRGVACIVRGKVQSVVVVRQPLRSFITLLMPHGGGGIEEGQYSPRVISREIPIVFAVVAIVCLVILVACMFRSYRSGKCSERLRVTFVVVCALLGAGLLGICGADSVHDPDNLGKLMRVWYLSVSRVSAGALAGALIGFGLACVWGRVVFRKEAKTGV